MPYHTVSDGYTEVECPTCGKLNDWTDLAVDGCLVKGRTEECTNCKALIRITAVDYEVVITAENVTVKE
jgi:phage FluMu protein Com